MDLLFSGLSPYVRKVRVVAHEVGVADRLRLVPINARERPEEIFPHNPLGKIPVFVTDTGATIYDSPVICEYLNAEYGNWRLMPATGLRRWEIATGVALADGVADAAVLARQERARPAAQQSAETLAWQLKKVHGGLAAMNARIERIGSDLDLAQIALACAMGYIAVRLPELAGFKDWPALAAWYERIETRPSFQATKPVM